VDLFFALSGFLISWRLLDEHAQTSTISLGAFYLRRAFRILPAYVTCLLALAALAAAVDLGVSAREWVSSTVFLRNYVALDEGSGWYTAHFWSLAVEEHFYLVWPFTLAFIGVRRARWAAIAIALAVTAWRVVEFRWQAVPVLLGPISFHERTDVRLDALLWGCVAALWLHKIGAARLKDSIPVHAAWAAAALIVVVAVAQPPLTLLWQSALFPLLFVATMLYPTTLLGRLLELPVVRWIGRLSYSLYLWQQLFLVAGAEPRPLPLGALQEWPLNLVALLTCAAISYYAIEQPALAFGHSLARRRSAAPVLVPAPVATRP
jgi:peptidoglycan/LPS O-acetylase OafA/YrhL